MSEALNISAQQLWNLYHEKKRDPSEIFRDILVV